MPARLALGAMPPAAPHDPAPPTQGNRAAASPCLRPSGFPPLAPHLHLVLEDVRALRKREGINSGLEAGVICLQIPWRSRHPELAPHVFGKPACAGDKVVERGHEARWGRAALGGMLDHGRHRIAAGALTCQGKCTAPHTPVPAASPCRCSASCPALDDPALFVPFFRGPTSDRWRVFLAALFAMPMDDAALGTCRDHTGRAEPPAAPFTEAGRSAASDADIAMLQNHATNKWGR